MRQQKKKKRPRLAAPLLLSFLSPATSLTHLDLLILHPLAVLLRALDDAPTWAASPRAHATLL